MSETPETIRISFKKYKQLLNRDYCISEIENTLTFESSAEEKIRVIEEHLKRMKRIDMEIDE